MKTRQQLTYRHIPGKADHPTNTKTNKKPFSKRTVVYFINLLNLQLHELSADRTHMVSTAMNGNLGGGGDLSSVPIHMADQGTDTYEREFHLDLVQVNGNRIRDIRDALRKTKGNTYGFCEDCGNRILWKRLNAKPDARLCLFCKEKREAASNRHGILPHNSQCVAVI